MSFRDHVPVGAAAWSQSQTSPIAFVVDTDPSVRASLEILMRKIGWRARTFASAEDFLGDPRQDIGPSFLICEVVLPGLSGLELQARLPGDRSIPVVFLTNHFNVSATVRAMKAGAVEFLTKPLREETIIPALNIAVERSREALRHEFELRELRGRYATLSAREKEVMELVMSGLLNKQVADRLSISEITVKVHRGKVMKKMGADSLPALIYMAATLGLPWPTCRIRPLSWTLKRTRAPGAPPQVITAMS